MDTPFVCNMNVLSETQRKRCREIIGNLDASRQSNKELGDGYAFRFKAESRLILEAAEFSIFSEADFFGILFRLFTLRASVSGFSNGSNAMIYYNRKSLLITKEPFYNDLAFWSKRKLTLNTLAN